MLLYIRIGKLSKTAYPAPTSNFRQLLQLFHSCYFQTSAVLLYVSTTCIIRMYFTSLCLKTVLEVNIAERISTGDCHKRIKVTTLSTNEHIDLSSRC